MAMLFANALSALASIANNGVSTYTLIGIWDETECPKEML